MDHLIYTAMSAASTLLDRQAVVSNNLANADTNGFRADISVFQQAPITGKGMQTRTQVASGSSGVDFTPGAVQTTGRPLDVALPGPGFLAVQAADGNEAYTRAGSLQVAADGTLVTSTGLAVLGDGGPISIPPDTTVSIAADGTVSGISTAPPFTAPTPLDRSSWSILRPTIWPRAQMDCSAPRTAQMQRPIQAYRLPQALLKAATSIALK
jgi:flagellar basal-body rod protein FlgF